MSLALISELMRLDRCDILSAEKTEDDDVSSREEIRLIGSFKRSQTLNPAALFVDTVHGPCMGYRTRT